MKNLHDVPKPPAGFHQGLLQTLDSLPERKEGTPVKHKHLTRILVAAAVVAALAVGAFAVGQLWMINSSSSRAEDFDKLPDASWAAEQIGARPALLERFSNGYAFKRGSIVANNLISQDGTSQKAYTSLDLDYFNGKERVSLNLSGEEYPAPAGAEVIERDGLTMRYLAFTQKVVPPDYELTAKDQAAVDAGEIVISYGGNGEMMACQSLQWTAEGVSYELYGHDLTLGREELAEMARELMAAE